MSEHPELPAFLEPKREKATVERKPARNGRRPQIRSASGPIILMGYNYPGYPVLGVVLMTLYTTGLGVVLGYAVLKSGSVLLAAYLHALNNQVAAFVVAMGFSPHNPAFSFLIGVYGIAMTGIVALLILCGPIWRGRGSTFTSD